MVIFQIKKKLLLTAIIILFVSSSPCISLAKSGLEALYNLKDVSVNLKIHENISPGVTKQKIDKSVLLNYTKKELAEKLSRLKGINLQFKSGPLLNIKVVIKGERNAHLKENIYYITVNASVKQGQHEWLKEYNASWPTNHGKLTIDTTKDKVIEKKENLEVSNKLVNNHKESFYAKRTQSDAEKRFANSKKRLANTKQQSSLQDEVKNYLRILVDDFESDLKVVSELQPHKKTFVESDSTNNQEDKVQKPSLQNEVNNYLRRYAGNIKSGFNKVKNYLRRYGDDFKSGFEVAEEDVINQFNVYKQNILGSNSVDNTSNTYTAGQIVKLNNPSDDSVSLYKDSSLKEITNLFTNGVRAKVTEVQGYNIYKVKVGEYTGWVSGSVIKKITDSQTL